MIKACLNTYLSSAKTKVITILGKYVYFCPHIINTSKAKLLFVYCPSLLLIVSPSWLNVSLIWLNVSPIWLNISLIWLNVSPIWLNVNLIWLNVSPTLLVPHWKMSIFSCLNQATYFLIINVPVVDFDAGNIHYKGHWKGWALKIETF
jgi:hypothetical protein